MRQYIVPGMGFGGGGGGLGPGGQCRVLMGLAPMMNELHLLMLQLDYSV